MSSHSGRKSMKRGSVAVGGRGRKSTAAALKPGAEALNEEELLFLWKGLVENGQLCVTKLQGFMKDIAGVNLSNVQARDLLHYMDANGDGRVGMEDFKNFLSIGHLSETDAKSFMWEPRKKFQEENPYYKVAHAAAIAHDQVAHRHHGDHYHHESHEKGHDDHHGHGHRADHDGHDDDHDHADNHSHHIQRSSTGLRHSSHKFDSNKFDSNSGSDPHVHPPDGKAPVRKRPQGHGHGHGQIAPRGSIFKPMDSVALEKQALDILNGPGQEQHRPGDKAAAEAAAAPKKVVVVSPETEKKIEQALEKYEKQSWDKFLLEEKVFKRGLFETYAGLGGDELEASEYHKMLSTWLPFASWCAPRGVRPADSLACLEYVQRRDLEDRGVITSVLEGGSSPPAPIAEGEEVPPQPEVKMSYGLWLDVLNGKHRPEEHATEKREHHGMPGADG